jgi:hypothetical protein
MLARMRRSDSLRHCAFVATFALALVACTGAAPPTPTPVATVRPSPTPAKSPDLGVKYATAMIAAFERDPLVLHVVQTSKMTAADGRDSVKVTASVDLDVSDRDLKAHMVTKTGGKTVKLDLIVVGTTVYARAGSGRWAEGSRSSYEHSISDIFRGLQPIRNPAHLGYVGIETIDKHKLHHLKAVKKFPYVLNGQSGTYTSFDIWVEEDGTPVLAKGKVSTIGAYGIEIKGTSELRFSKFGGKIKITAPKN